MKISQKTGNKDPLVHIIIVTWNSRKQLEYCLPTVVNTEYSNYKIVIVDNNSSDGTIDFVEKAYKDVQIIRNTKNRGYAGGNNDGIKYALAEGAEYVTILNPDMKVDTRWISQAVKGMESSSFIGIVGFNVIGEEKREENDDALFEAEKKRYKQLTIESLPDHIILAGMALFCRASMFENVGFFDEKYFCYVEEIDLESRMRRAGYSIVRINIPLWHEGEGSSRNIPVKKAYLSMRNTIRYGVKNKGIKENLRLLRFLLNTACRKNRNLDMRYFNHKRLCPSTSLINLGLLSGAFLWNLFYFPQTLLARQEANRMILKRENSR